MNEIQDNLSDILRKGKDITYQEILINLIDGKDNLDLKSEINQPKELASLYVLAKYLDNSNFPNTAKVIKYFITRYLRYMISYKRQSRKEIIEAISSFNKEADMSIIEKLTSNLK